MVRTGGPGLTRGIADEYRGVRDAPRCQRSHGVQVGSTQDTSGSAQVNQAALDTLLATSAPDVHERFVSLTARLGTVLPTHDTVVRAQAPATSGPPPPRRQEDGAGRRRRLPGGPKNEPVWLPAFYIDVFPVTNNDYARFVAATGHEPPQHWHRRQMPRRHPRSPGRLRHLARRLDVRGVGRQGTADRPAVGEGGPWHTRRHLPVGQQRHPGQVQLPRERHRLHDPGEPLPQRRLPRTASTTSAATPGSGARPAPSRAATSSRPAP